jgi:hypothetical protein
MTAMPRPCQQCLCRTCLPSCPNYDGGKAEEYADALLELSGLLCRLANAPELCEPRARSWLLRFAAEMPPYIFDDGIASVVARKRPAVEDDGVRTGGLWHG